MSRPIDADGTISVSYPAARADPPLTAARLTEPPIPIASTAAHNSRSSIDRLLIMTSLVSRPANPEIAPVPQGSQSHPGKLDAGND